MTGALAQLARASALQAECQGFESLKLHQYTTIGVGADGVYLEEAVGSSTNGRIAQLVRARP
jgi:hypothetical protein